MRAEDTLDYLYLQRFYLDHKTRRNMLIAYVEALGGSVTDSTITLPLVDGGYWERKTTTVEFKQGYKTVSRQFMSAFFYHTHVDLSFSLLDIYILYREANGTDPAKLAIFDSRGEHEYTAS